MICFHGTTDKNLVSIINGIDDKINSVSPWNVSLNDGAFYLWPSDKLDGNDQEEKTMLGIDMAFGAAQCAAAISGSNKIYAIMLEVDDELLEDDYSCPNMSDSASYIPLECLDEVKIIGVYECDFDQRFAVFHVAMLWRNEKFNFDEIDSGLYTAAEILANSDCELYLDSMHKFDYKEIDFLQYKNNIKAVA